MILLPIVIGLHVVDEREHFADFLCTLQFYGKVTVVSVCGAVTVGALGSKYDNGGAFTQPIKNVYSM